MRSPTSLRLRDRSLDLSRPLVMAIVNASPDSFSDGAQIGDAGAQADRALAALDEGADLVDIGGQSGITQVPEIDEQLEIDRVVPVIERVVAARPDAVVSVDTYRPAVTRAALDAGASLINDVSCLLHPEVAEVCGRAGAGLVVMHTKVAPKQRLQDPGAYRDVAAEVADVLAERVSAAEDLGVDPASIVVDPGVDYAKTPHQTVELLRDLDPVLDLGRPVLYALSRKDFIGAVTGRAPQERGAGTLAAIAHVGPRPGSIFRVHDVAATVDLLAVARALAGQVDLPEDLLLADRLRWANGDAGRADRRSPTRGERRR